jgi:hypothetical protein
MTLESARLKETPLVDRRIAIAEHSPNGGRVRLAAALGIDAGHASAPGVISRAHAATQSAAEAIRREIGASAWRQNMSKRSQARPSKSK